MNFCKNLSEFSGIFTNVSWRKILQCRVFVDGDMSSTSIKSTGYSMATSR